MQKFLFVVFIALLPVGISACQQLPNKHWSKAIPKKTPAVIIPSPGLSPRQALQQEYMPFLDDITSSAIQLISEVDSAQTASLRLNALLLYPGVSQKLQPVWLMQAPNGFVKKLYQRFYKEFTQNKYYFHDRTIYKLNMQDRILFASQLNELLLISESSLAIEDALRAYLGLGSPIAIERSQIKAPSLVLNTPSLDYWAEQLIKVQYRPRIKNALKGTGPTIVQVSKLDSTGHNNELQFTGNIPLEEKERSPLVDALSSENIPITLDRYISSDASTFGIFRLPPRLAPPSSVPDTSRLDSLFLADSAPYHELANSLNPEFSVVAYTESGFLSTGEHLFLRKLNNRNRFVNQLEELSRDGYLRKSGNSYFAESRILAQLIGSELCDYDNFYLDVTGDVVVISRRRGLAERVESDRDRRQVIYYNQDYMDIRRNLPDEMSGYLFTNSDFGDFLQPFLDPDTYVNAITSQFNQLTMTLQLDPDKKQLAFTMRTYTREENNIPYVEQWFFPTGGAEISGDPVLSDVRGSTRDEVIFSTKSGSVYMIASDGTTIMQVNTGEDQPIGSPVVYDWYGTNQKVILQAAGNKIYGWNDSGTSLPKFPFVLDEKITTPLAVADIDRNGLPEAIVATANRQLHALDGRGNNINGWPVSTNTPIENPPLVDTFQNSNAVIAFAENAVHAWNPNGTPKANFPRFINASLNGSPTLYDGKILAAAADGYLYAVGPGSLFPDSVNVYSTRADADGTEAVYVSNTGLRGTPSVHTLTVQTDEQTVQEDMILAMSSNGSVFLINEQGQLRFTKSMGQPAAQDFSPYITDINSDGVQDLISLAGYGRLYAWQVIDGKRIYSLPSSGMQHPVITDLDGDGNKELIAQTSEGLRCWTIYNVSVSE